MKDTILGVIRHILTAFGGGLVTNGSMADSDLQAIVGGIVALVGVVWSILEKRSRKNVPVNTNN